MAGYWLKLYTEILEDPKYYRLSDNAKLGMIELMLVAKKIDLDGGIPGIEDVAFYTRRDVEWWTPVLEELSNIEYLVNNGTETIIRKFAERQAAITDAERAKRSREKRNVSQFSHEPVTICDGDTEEEEDKRKKKIIQDATSTSSKGLSNETFASSVFTKITGMLVFPAACKVEAMSSIEALRSEYDTTEKMVSYLSPFWKEWKGREYRKTNLAWLTDWAVSGEIPVAKSASTDKKKEFEAEMKRRGLQPMEEVR